MLKQLLVIIPLIVFQVSVAQKRGVNYDPESNATGVKPYEMASRQQDKVPLADFDDCTKWFVETENCRADLFLTTEQRLFRENCGKLVYTTTEKRASVALRLENPVAIDDPWDCIDFWNFGAHWLWGEPNYNTSFRHYALIEDADGRIHELDFSQAGYGGMVHKYWFLSHIKLNREIRTPARFAGISFKGNNTEPGKRLTIYLGPIYIYNELLGDLSFRNFPEKLPFPLRRETILPVNHNPDYRNKVQRDGTAYRFFYAAEHIQMDYSVDPSKGILNGIGVRVNNNNYQLCKGGEMIFSSPGEVVWNVREEEIKGDTLFVHYTATVDAMDHEFSCWYTINQKSLIVAIHEVSENGHVKEITLGRTGEFKESRLITVPFMPYNYGRHPKLLLGDNLFFFRQFDWYYTDASNFTTDNVISEGWADYNKGCEYIPKTDGKRNPVREKLFITVSGDVTEVLPVIDNPASPMRSLQAHRLWMIEGGDNYEANLNKVKRYRSLGLENVTIRYHEGYWRDGGESYTFRTRTAPGRGGDAAVKEFIKAVKDQDWQVGLYTNYTDFAPVNENWDPDWVLRGPSGEWQVSWSRCYAPKPMVALEQQTLNAPVINKSLGPNHSYCDVHTAVSPMSRVDYDHRVPGAGTFRRTFECFGLLLLNERVAYRGPVFSEGGNHWWYAGLTDGNYANYTPRINSIPVIPEFQLLKIHPLQMDAGNLAANGSEYLAYTLAYGHIGILNGDENELIKRYAFLQPLQNHYSMVPVNSISYFKDGKEYNSSQALQQQLNENAQLKVTYASGFTVYVNFSAETWTVNAMDKTFRLPRHGILAFSDDWKTYAFSGLCDDFVSDEVTERIDMVMSENLFYTDTYGALVSFGNFDAEGTVYLKKEKFGWEIIPARDFVSFAFDPEVLQLHEARYIIEGVGEDDILIEDAAVDYSGGKVRMEHKNKSIFKYRIVPSAER
jgi:hypothetical protein